MKKKLFPCFSLALARFLTDNHFQIVKISPNRDRPWMNVFYFEDSDNLQKCDYEQLEYLIQYIDWFLTEDIQLNDQSLTVLMEEIITTAIHTLDLDILDVLPNLQQIKEELYAKI